ncbi:MAG: DUF1579 domain-containing protein [Gammaproteobacteria bacterium]|nr:DUF1579 domain-containing protein [Gammaproteobacteria bacterium]
MYIKRAILIWCVLAAGASWTHAADRSFLDLLSGNWQGDGELLGQEAAATLRFERILGGNFLRQEYRNDRHQAEGKISFSAVAIYKVNKDGSLIGHWYDSRGVVLPLSGKTSANRLEVEWGTLEIEQGRTVYEISEDGELRVTDYVLREGAYQQFGLHYYSNYRKNY